VVDGVSFSFGGAPVLENVSLTVEAGEFLGVVGPNGAGKTTLLKVLLGLVRPTSGSVSVLGQPAHLARPAVGYVPQLSLFPRDFPISVEETVLMGRLGGAHRLGGYGVKDRAAGEKAMQQTEILDVRARRLGTLSGGQLQRVLVARALASEPRILMLDEPTANIDLRAEVDIFDLLKRLRESRTVVVVSHDIGFISRYVTRVACLNRTLVCHRTDAITGEVIEELYARPVRMIHHVH
jgi:zinc transport system ATP-binding protein